MTRKAAVDALRLEFLEENQNAHFATWNMGDRLVVHFARCNQMNEEQRRIKTAARIREVGRMKTDLSVELNETKKQVKHAFQDSQQKEEEKIDVTEFQKKLVNMVKRTKLD